MVLLGHLHTHEFAAGGTTDQVGNPWAPERSPGGSSGGSAAALAALHGSRSHRDRDGGIAPHSVRLLRHLGDQADPRRGSRWRESCRWPGASTTPARWRARLPTAGCCWRRWRGRAGDVPRALSTRPSSGRRCRARARPARRRTAGRLSALAGSRPRRRRGDGLRARARRVPSSRRRARRAAAARGEPIEVGDDFLDVLTTELLVYHRRFDGRRELYRPSLREWVEEGERRAVSGEAYVCGAGAAARADTVPGRPGWTSTAWRPSSSRRSRSSLRCAGTGTSMRAATTR